MNILRDILVLGVLCANHSCVEGMNIFKIKTSNKSNVDNKENVLS